MTAIYLDIIKELAIHLLSFYLSLNILKKAAPALLAPTQKDTRTHFKIWIATVLYCSFISVMYLLGAMLALRPIIDIFALVLSLSVLHKFTKKAFLGSLRIIKAFLLSYGVVRALEYIMLALPIHTITTQNNMLFLLATLICVFTFILLYIGRNLKSWNDILSRNSTVLPAIGVCGIIFCLNSVYNSLNINQWYEILDSVFNSNDRYILSIFAETAFDEGIILSLTIVFLGIGILSLINLGIANLREVRSLQETIQSGKRYAALITEKEKQKEKEKEKIRSELVSLQDKHSVVSNQLNEVRESSEAEIKQLKKQLTEEKKENRKISKALDEIRIANHDSNTRLAALEKSVLEKQGQSNTDALLESIEAIKNELRTPLSKIAKALPKTNVGMIDVLFDYYNDKCLEDEITFNLAIRGDIVEMIWESAPSAKIETLIATHINNAINAVKASENTHKSIMVFLGYTGGVYAFSVHDTGIPFNVDTLAALGEKRVTTHENADDHGIGFMTSFDIMREYKASLYIDEKPPNRDGHTKSVTIKFDNKNIYSIKTFRPNEFPKNDRYEILNSDDA
ncbi:MAG: hypothetical protein FWG87_03945 [Defluviitaleaceae bacterium]|nr:hypothetical protein [Defluviitaleaceae bacterium]